jgi:hypothetical protein
MGLNDNHAEAAKGSHSSSANGFHVSEYRTPFRLQVSQVIEFPPNDSYHYQRQLKQNCHMSGGKA